jgi:uncharacterized membrane protein YhaH (DUF805 family)
LDLKHWLAFLFSFRGRIRRTTFGFIVLGYAAYVIVVIVAVETLLPPTARGLWFLGMWFPAAVVVVAAVVCRLHDRGRSAWWLSVFFGAPFAVLFPGFALSLAHQNGTISTELFYAGITPLLVVGNALLWWGVVEIGFLPGTKGENRFGPDPRANSSHQLTPGGAQS